MCKVCESKGIFSPYSSMSCKLKKKKKRSAYHQIVHAVLTPFKEWRVIYLWNLLNYLVCGTMVDHWKGKWVRHGAQSQGGHWHVVMG